MNLFLEMKNFLKKIKAEDILIYKRVGLGQLNLIVFPQVE